MLPSESEARHFTLGAPIVSPPWATADLLKKSVEYLRWKLPDHTFSLRWIELGKIENELVQGKIDLAVLPSFPLNPAAPSVGRILASVRTSDAPDPDAGAGCLILTRKNLNAEELANARFGAESSLSVPGYLACAQELVRLGIPVTLIESRTKFFGDLEARRILRSLGKGEIDAAFLRAGLAEDTERANGRRILDGFTVMRPKKDALRAVHSSEVFPAPTLISGTAIPSETQHRILTTLLTMPPDGYGAQWTIPAQSTAVNRLTRDLEIEPYEYLRHWTLSRIWKEYRAGVLLAAVILFSMLCHGWLLEKLVRTRTAQLRKALADQLAAEKLAALKSEELKRTERKAVVAQLSSIFAHEISSPLSALQNLVRGVRLSIDRRLESEKELESEDLEAVDDQLSDVESQIGKVSAIVSKVRNYARGVSLRKPFRLDKLLSEVADLASKRSVHAVAVTVRNRAGAVAFTGDALEFELIILNLVKNAIEAAESVPSPAVLCTLSRNADEIVLEIADNGPALTEEAWSNLNSRNRTSSKSKGLGLGLGIVTALVEKYGGSLSFHRLDEGGTAARVRLPYTP